jgi:hypothetical protein
VDYFKVGIADRPGEAARLLDVLRANRVNLLAFTGFPRGRRAQTDFIPEDAVAFKKAMKQAGINAGQKKTLFLIQGEDRVGAMADILDKLGKAGINVTAVDAVTDGAGRFAALLWVQPGDVARSARVLAGR